MTMIPPARDDALEVPVIKQDCIICDLDGTLANNKHRQHFLDGDVKHWIKFFAAMPNDLVVPEVRFLLQCIHAAAKTVRIVIATGRPSEYEALIKGWLLRAKVPYHMLFMRAQGDYRADYVVKYEMLVAMRSANLNPVLSIDDRPEVVDMWRANGVPCIQCDASDWLIRERGDHEGDPVKFLKMMASVPGSDPMYRVAIDELERKRV